jgi:hypothetical protein
MLDGAQGNPFFTQRGGAEVRHVLNPDEFYTVLFTGGTPSAVVMTGYREEA